MVRARAHRVQQQPRVTHRYAPHAGDEAEVHGAFAERRDQSYDGDGAREQAGSSKAGDGAADDEGNRGRRKSRDQAAQLKDEDGR